MTSFAKMTIPLPAEVAAIYSATSALEARYGRKFTPDGHLVGSIGEAIAAEAFKLELLPASTNAHDARTEDGRLVQIKLTAGASVSLNADCSLLLVMRIVSDVAAEVVYFGPGAPIWSACGSMQKNGQRRISLSKIRRIADTPDVSELLERPIG